MLTHPQVVEVFNEVLGPGFRFDHGPMLIQMVRETEGHWLHGGLTFEPLPLSPLRSMGGSGAGCAWPPFN